MNILALDTATKSCSAAILKDQTLLMQIDCNLGRTHSQTAMQQVHRLLQSAELAPKDFDLLAVTVGPGSFTGLRIGISGLKGLCLTNPIPCAAVSTLEALAVGVSLGWHFNKQQPPVICSVLDARQNRVFGGLFTPAPNEPFDWALNRLCEDTTFVCADLAALLKTQYAGRPLVLLGDGVPCCLPALEQAGLTPLVMPTKFWMPSAYSVGLLGLRMAQNGQTCTADQLMPLYPEQPKAQRELEARLAAQNNA